MAQGGVDPVGTLAVFRGMTQLALDAKGRLAIPGKHHAALTGAASQEFGNVQGTLESTRQMLSDMNTQFGAMQAAFFVLRQKSRCVVVCVFERWMKFVPKTGIDRQVGSQFPVILRKDCVGIP